MSLSFRLITTRFGHLGVVGDARRLRQVYLPQMWADGLRDTILRDFPDAVEDDGLQPGLTDALRRYFAGQPVTFDARIRWDGTTEFVRTVCQVCRAIPYGQTVSYQQLAEQAGRPKAARAVGMAMRRNPCPIVVPCHRVLRSDGSLGGYCGAAGVEFKRRLLEMEAAAIAQAGGLA